VSGSTAPITSDHLLVEDADTPADEIVYTLLTAPTNGDLIIDEVGVTRFTQQLVNDRRVLFAHRGNVVSSRSDHNQFQPVLGILTRYCNTLLFGAPEYNSLYPG